MHSVPTLTSVCWSPRRLGSEYRGPSTSVNWRCALCSVSRYRSKLPVPTPARESETFTRIAGLSRAAAADPRDAAVRAELQARVTHAYGLDERDFMHVLGTFPIVPEDERDAALHVFRCARYEL